MLHVSSVKAKQVKAEVNCFDFGLGVSGTVLYQSWSLARVVVVDIVLTEGIVLRLDMEQRSFHSS